MNIKEKCIDILLDFILDNYGDLSVCNWSSADDFIMTDIDDARNKIIEIANITDEKELLKIYDEIKKEYT